MKHMSMSREFNIRQNYTINIDAKPFDTVANSSYLDITGTERNSIHEQRKNRMKLQNVSYRSAQCPMPPVCDPKTQRLKYRG